MFKRRDAGFALDLENGRQGDKANLLRKISDLLNAKTLRTLSRWLRPRLGEWVTRGLGDKENLLRKISNLKFQISDLLNAETQRTPSLAKIFQTR